MRKLSIQINAVFQSPSEFFLRVSPSPRPRVLDFDGMQGAAYPRKLPVCHSYIVCDTLPTRFYVQGFGTKYLNEIKNNWFVELGKQATIEKVFYPKPFDIFLMTAYQVHEAVPASVSTWRTFMRIEFTLKQYNRVGNTVNPLIPVDWKFVDREIPKYLRTGQLRDTGWNETGRYMENSELIRFREMSEIETQLSPLNG